MPPDGVAGTCGDWMFVVVRGGDVGYEAWFSRTGQLIGMTESSDASAFCSGKSFTRTFGTVPECSLRETVVFCARFGGDPLLDFILPLPPPSKSRAK
jgi:hypothetical protein